MFARLASLRRRLFRINHSTAVVSLAAYGLVSTWPNTGRDRRAGSTAALRPANTAYMERYLAPDHAPEHMDEVFARETVAAAQFCTLRDCFGLRNRAAFFVDSGDSITTGIGRDSGGDSTTTTTSNDEDEDVDEDNDDNEGSVAVEKMQWWHIGPVQVLLGCAVLVQAVALGELSGRGWRWALRALYAARQRDARELNVAFVQVAGPGCGDVSGEEGKPLYLDPYNEEARLEQWEREMAAAEIDTSDGHAVAKHPENASSPSSTTSTTDPSSSSSDEETAVEEEPRAYTLHHYITEHSLERDMTAAEITVGRAARTEPVLITWLHNERYLHFAFAPRQDPSEGWWRLARIWGVDDYGDEHVEAALAMRNPIELHIETSTRPAGVVLWQAE